jgi:predicted TIM-barrel fold metal-dependent hydrolase
LLASGAREVSAQTIPIIDAHSQFDQFVELGEVMKLLDQGQISRVILSDRSTKNIDRGKDLLALASKYPDRITPAVRTKPGTPMTDEIYAQYLDRQARNPAYGALAEVISTHAAMRNQYFELAKSVEILPSDAWIQAAVRLAEKKNWPFLIHIEFRHIGKRKALFMEKLEALIAAHLALPVGLMHIGQLEAPDVDRLIKKYPNVFFMLSMTNPVILRKAEVADPGRGWTDIFDGNRLRPEWQQLILTVPERFVLAFDNVFKQQWSPIYIQQIAFWRGTFSNLPVPVAHAIAHENAERLWHLPPTPPFK